MDVRGIQSPVGYSLDAERAADTQSSGNGTRGRCPHTSPMPGSGVSDRLTRPSCNRGPVTETFPESEQLTEAAYTGSWEPGHLGALTWSSVGHFSVSRGRWLPCPGRVCVRCLAGEQEHLLARVPSKRDLGGGMQHISQRRRSSGGAGGSGEPLAPDT